MLVRVKRPKTSITMWELLVWTYQRQKVRHAGGREWPLGYGAGLGSTLTRLANGLPRAPAVTSAMPVHEDALTVHGHVLRLAADERAIVIESAERGSPPDWNPRIPPCKIVPVLRGNGKPKMLYAGRRHVPIACLIAYEGVLSHHADAMREQARMTYTTWYAALDSLSEILQTFDGLGGWEVLSVGGEQEPWR